MPTRHGFVLPVTLFALILIGVIVTGGIFISTQETRIGTSYALESEAFSVAEYGLQEVLGTWRNNQLKSAARDSVARTGVAWSGSRRLGTYEVTVDSLGGGVYAVHVTGAASRGSRSASHGVAALLRTVTATLPYETALTLLGTLSVEGRAEISGNDACLPWITLPGVITTDVANVTETGRGTVEGDPPVESDTTLSVASLSDYGDVDLQDLIDWATKVYPPGANPTNMAPTTTTDGDGDIVCDTSDPNNWGDTIRSNPCGEYFPVIYGQGDLSLNGAGSGAMAQGILIVEGDLTIDGNVEFRGIVIAKGDLYYAGNGGHVVGSMIVMGNQSSTSAGSSELTYSSCWVQDALNGGVRARPLSSRSWVDLSGNVRPLPVN